MKGRFVDGIQIRRDLGEIRSRGHQIWDKWGKKAIMLVTNDVRKRLDEGGEGEIRLTRD